MATPPREPGTDAKGRPFDEAVVEAVWRKGIVMRGADAAAMRKDTCGAWISREQYGLAVEYGKGWVVDHIRPVSRGGTDSLANLQPLQWENNRAKGDAGPGDWTCARRAQT